MSMFTADDKCSKCGLCAKLCVAGIIAINGDKPFVPAENEQNCLQCGQCVAFCPTGAAALAFQPAADRVPINAALMPTAESGETFLRSRRSVRSYKDEPVDKALVMRILETCRYAPTASNSQLVRWVITENREKTKALAQVVVDFFRENLAQNPKLENADFLTHCLKIWEAGHDIVFRGAPQVAVAVYNNQYNFHEDAAIALTYFELAAHANKIGCCWAGILTRAARQSPQILEFLGVKKGEMLVGAQMFGYPKGISVSHILPPRKKIDLTWL